MCSSISKNFSPPAGLPVQRDEQRLTAPFALGAPRRTENRFVQSRAKHVAGGAHRLGRHAAGACTFLEFPQLIERLSAQSHDIRMA